MAAPPAPAQAPAPCPAPTLDPAPEPAPAPLLQPRSAGAMFRAFNRLALQGFGGVLPVAHRTLVERERWLSPQQFVELLTLGQVLPGPNIINMALILGDRFFGWRGALASVAGLLLVPMAIVLLAVTLWQQFAGNAWLVGALHGMGAVAAGLVLATAIKLARTLRGHVLGIPLCTGLAAAGFVAVGLLRWPLWQAVLVVGGSGMALAWRALARQQAAAAAPPAGPGAR